MTSWRRNWCNWLWLVVFALIAAQALGLVHRVVHSPLAALGHSVQVAHGLSADAGEMGHDSMASLFAGHGSDSDCRVYDQLGHSDAMPSVPAFVAPLILPAFVLQFFQGEVLARWAALYDARGPPPVR